MYREGEREKKPPTSIEYKASLIRAQGVLVGIIAVLFAAALLAVPHVAKVDCVRAQGTCTITRHSIFAPIEHESVPIDAVARVDSEKRSSGKGSFAIVSLRHKDGSITPLGTGILGQRFDVEDVTSGVPALNGFFTSPTTPSMDVTFYSGHVGSILSIILGLIVARVVFSIVREQTVQLFSIKVVADHENKLLLLPRGHKVRFDDVAEVVVQHGRALFWASGKNEHIPGFRVVVRTKNGVVIPLTNDHRVGPESRHEDAKKQILAAIGRNNEKA